VALVVELQLRGDQALHGALGGRRGRKREPGLRCAAVDALYFRQHRRQRQPAQALHEVALLLAQRALVQGRGVQAAVRAARA